jgi:beta-lactamase class A
MASDFYQIKLNNSRPRQTINPSVKLGIWVLIILGLVVLASNLSAMLGFKKNLEIPKFQNHSSANIIPPSPQLQKIVDESLKDIQGDFEIYIENMVTHEGLALRAQEKFPSASLYKLYLMAAVLKQVELGSIKLEDNLSADKSHLEEILGGKEIGYEDSADQISYSVDEALTRVGRISDNFSAVMLAEKIGWDKIQVLADSIGAQNTIIKSPIQTSAEDVSLFFKLLYQDKLVSPIVSKQVKDYLSLSQLNNRIPANLPESVTVIHKTGELPRVRHDAGIVYLDQPENGNSPAPSSTNGASLSPKKGYVIVMMSQNLRFEDDGIEAMAKLSEAVYNYFDKKID